MRLLWAVLISYGLLAAPLALAASPAEPLNIVVTIPVLKDLTEQVGGPHVRVTSLLSGYENEHTYSPKPSDLVAVRKARLLFEVGIGLEVWVSSLVKNAGSPSLRVVTTSKGIGFIRDMPISDGCSQAAKRTDRRQSSRMDGPGECRHDDAAYHGSAHSDRSGPCDGVSEPIKPPIFESWTNFEKELSDRVKRLADRRFIAHHPAWPYLGKALWVRSSATIQPQSGTEPSALQLHALIAKIKKDRIKVIVSEIQLSQKIPELLAKETKARAWWSSPRYREASHDTETYLDMLRYNVLQLANALEAA